MKHSITFRIAGFLLMALVTCNHYACKKVDLVRQPLVKVVDVTNITADSAVISGEVVDVGEVANAEYGFVYSNGDYPTVADKIALQSGNLTKGSFQKTITELESETEYKIRGFVHANDEYFYSDNIKTFTTPAVLPTVITSEVVNITSATAVSGGDVTDNGGATITARGVCWSQQVNPTIEGPKTVDGSGTGSFVSNIDGLSPSTIYYLRAYATNAIGTAYGTAKLFTTQSGGVPLYEWLQYDDGVNYSAIGFTGYNFDAIIRFPDNAIQPYLGWKITKMRFYKYGSSAATFTLEIFTGDNPDIYNPLVFDEISGIMSDQWNEYILPSPFTISENADLWIGYYVQNYLADEFPAGCDDGPAITGFGDLFYDYGNSQWLSLSTLSTPFDYNWNIQVYVTNERGEENLLPTKIEKTSEKQKTFSNKPTFIPQIKKSSNR